MHEKEKLEQRWPAAVEFIKSASSTNISARPKAMSASSCWAGIYNGVMRALQQLGLADVYGNSAVPLYVLNVAYPLIDDEMAEFCAARRPC